MSNPPSLFDAENLSRQEEASHSGHQGTSTATDGPTESHPPAEGGDISQERLLLYLKCLTIPPGKEQLTLALEALTRLGSEEGKQAITPAAMQSLRGLLLTSGAAMESSRQSKLYNMGLFKKGLEGLKSTPPLNRGHMLPVKFDQLPEWLSTESFLTTLITQLRPLLIPLLILFNILLLVVLFFWL